MRMRHQAAMAPIMNMWNKISLGPPDSTITDIPTAAWDTGIVGATHEGTITVVPTTNGGIEVEFPFYSNNLYLYSFYAGSGYVGAGNEANYFRTWKYTHDGVLNNYPTAPLTIERAAAEDFTYIRFQGSGYYSSNPVA